MTLDEMEAEAKRIAFIQERYGADSPSQEAAGQLARALLAVLPVVRAAEAQVKAWSRWESSRHHTQEELHTSLDASKALEDAIDEMRRRLGNAARR